MQCERCKGVIPEREQKELHGQDPLRGLLHGSSFCAKDM